VRTRQGRFVTRFEDAEPVLDVGCGRGEFLEQLRAESIEATGIDLDYDMVDLCQKKGLDVVQGDAVSHLERLSAAALGGIFASHVIEHMRADGVVALVREASRVLRVGGVMILETPNPTNLSALANFSLDFTHVRLYHPEAMRWLLEQESFDRVELDYASPVKLPEEIEPRDELAVDPMRSLLFGFEEYAVIGRKRPSG
jgi:SAM-dependent methyltransferase